jgi:hypothetical protein
MTPPEFYIDAIWVLNHAGILLFEETYTADITREGTATDLITAFLSAILTFAGEAFVDQIEHIQFSSRKIIFKFSDYVLFVIAADEHSAKDKQIRKLIIEIADKFGKKFNSYFEKSQFFDGKVSRFESFSEDLKDIVQKEPLSVKFLKALDYKENLKRVEELYQLRKKKLAARMKKIEGFFGGLSDKFDGKRKERKDRDETDKIGKWYVD